MLLVAIGARARLMRNTSTVSSATPIAAANAAAMDAALRTAPRPRTAGKKVRPRRARAPAAPEGATAVADPGPQVLGVRSVCARTSLHRTTLWRLEQAGGFPKRRQISPGRV